MTRNRTLSSRFSPIPLGLVVFLAACSSGGGSDSHLRINNPPTVPVQISALEPFSLQIQTSSGDGTLNFSLMTGPAGFQVDSQGLCTWTPTLSNLGTVPVCVQVADMDDLLQFTFDARVHQGVLMGTAYSPLGHVGSVSQQDGIDYLSSRSHGRLVGYHTNWRDVGDTNGEIPGLFQSSMAARDQFGVLPTLVVGWADGNGIADLTSDSEPGNNTWSNAETRTEFVDMVTALALQHQPRFLALANELNIWYATNVADYPDWLSLYSEAFDAIKAVSPETMVYATFQLEFLQGLGIGWPHGVTWTAFDQMVLTNRMDAAIFTTYPYLAFATAAAIDDDHYAVISDHWTGGPVGYTEMGWLSAPSFPYPGNETDQAEFITRFFELNLDFELLLVQWLFLHDLDIEALFPPFVGVGLRDNSAGDIRPADMAWQDAVSLREQG